MSKSGAWGSGGSGGPPSGQGIPETIDHYRILRKLGRGGQGDVFLGHDPNLDIDVAIKVLLADYRTEEVIGRFTVEARTAVRLTAPNIVRVYNFNPKYPYLVMEYCGDGDLNQLIKSRARQPLAHMVSLIRQILDALVVAHENEHPILHRDLKPGNVLFNRGVPKVADFGLAKMLTGATSGLTTTRGMMGTVGYSSPEQLRDASTVDHRSDLWSVGVMLYELLTYTRPFDKSGDDYVNVAIKVRMEPPAAPPYEVPAPIWAVVQKALEKDPDVRYGSAREMISDLDEALRAIPDADTMLIPPQSALDEMDRMAADAASLMSSGSTDEAETLVKKMRSISPDDSLPRYWMRQIRATREVESSSASGRSVDSVEQRAAEMLESRLNSIQQMITSREYREARRQIGELMVEDPDNSVIHRYLERINKEESAVNAALNSAHGKAEEARRAGDYQAVAQVWQSFNEQYPGHPDIEAELAVANKEVEVQRQRAEREARLDRARAQAEQRLAAGDRQGALALWEAVLRDDPGSDEARDRVETLQRELWQEERDRALKHTRAGVGGRLAAGDTAGALALWRVHAKAYPEDAEAQAEIRKLNETLERQQRESAQAEIESLVARFEPRLAGSRYDGLPEVAEAARQALSRAREAARTGKEPPRAVEERLVEATRAAESGLYERLRSAREALASLLEQAAEMSRAGETEEGAAASPAEDDLARAVMESAAALCEVLPPERPGDPLPPLAAAAERLERCMDRLAQERREAIDRARGLAAEAIETARAAIEAIGPLDDDAGRVEADGLRQELARLGEEIESRSAGKLVETRARAAALEQAAATLAATARWHWSRELVSLRDDSLGFISGHGGAELAALAGQASAHLETARAEAAAVPAGTRELIGRLREAMDAARHQTEQQEAEARRNWAAALASWEQAAGSAGEESAGSGETFRQQGVSALEREDWAEAGRATDRLNAVARRAGLEAIWVRQQGLVRQVEEAAEEGEKRGGSLLEQLAGYRAAFAEGETDKLRGLEAGLKRGAKQAGRGGGRAGAGRLARIPAAGRRMRAANKALQPDALQQYDRAIEAYERAADGRGDSREAADELLRAHARLIEPDPAWPGLVPVGLAAVILALAAWAARPPEPTGLFDVTLLSPGGEVRVAQLSRDGVAVTDLPGDGSVVGEDGLRWSLEPGSYRLRTGEGAEFGFRVPQDRAVVIREEPADFGPELLRELNLDDSGETR